MTLTPILQKEIDPHTRVYIISILNHSVTTIFDLDGTIRGKGTTPIHYTTLGRPFIIRYQQIYYLDTFTRLPRPTTIIL